MLQRVTTTADAEIGKRIRSARILAGMSQAVLGETLGVSFQQVQKYEKGTNRVSATRVQTIAAALNTSPTFILNGDAAEAPAAGSNVASLMSVVKDTHGRALVEAFVKIERADHRKIVADLAITLAELT